jgi:hypothetical protein
MRWVFYVLAATAAAWGLWTWRRERRERVLLLGGRQNLSLEELYAQFDDKSIAFEAFGHAWREVASYLRVSPGTLRATDRLEDLAPRFVCLQSDLDDLEVFVNLRGRRITGDREELNVETIGDVVRLLSAGTIGPTQHRA